MKKFVAITLLLALVLGLCAPAMAAYPTAKFKSTSKNLWVSYYGEINWKVSANAGSYNKVKKTGGGYIYRAGYTIVIKKGSLSEKPFDIDYTGKGTVNNWFAPTRSGVVYRPSYGYYSKWKVTLQSYYKPTYGYTVYEWTKCGSAKTTNLYVEH